MEMSKAYRDYDPEQPLQLPTSQKEWLPDDYLAYFVSDVVDRLDLFANLARCAKGRRGGPPHHPRLTVKVLLYGCHMGITSARRLARHLHEDIGLRVLAANQTPDFRTLSDFRKPYLQALRDLFLQALELCQRAGLVQLGHVVLDSTKVKAKASMHHAMSYGRIR